jgi:pimeloyl-ACP methyl ester carboxylesterase
VEAVLFAWVPERLRPQVAVMQRRAFELQAEAGDVAEAPDPVEDLEPLRSIEAPALVTAGEYDMPDFVRGAEEMARAIPHAHLELIPDVGHLAPLEAPGEFRELLLDFLGEHSQV